MAYLKYKCGRSVVHMMLNVLSVYLLVYSLKMLTTFLWQESHKEHIGMVQ